MYKEITNLEMRWKRMKCWKLKYVILTQIKNHVVYRIVFFEYFLHFLSNTFATRLWQNFDFKFRLFDSATSEAGASNQRATARTEKS